MFSIMNKKNQILILIVMVLIALGLQYFTMQHLSWFESISSITAQTGTLIIHDKQGLPIKLEWKRTSLQSSDFSEITKSVSEIAVQAYASVETQFLHEYPQAVLEDEYLKFFEPLFVNGIEIVDWSLVEAEQQAKMKSIFEMDLTSMAPEVIASLPKDTYFFVMARDVATSQLIGFIQFAVAPYYPSGDVKVISIVVAPEEQNRGLGKLLMSSVFKIIPNIQRVFLSTRPTNKVAIQAYQAWGFTLDDNPIQDPYWKAIENHWIYFDYKVNKTDILQNSIEFIEL